MKFHKITKRFAIILFALAATHSAHGQGTGPSSYSRLNGFSAYALYSNTSSHIHWGVSRQRRIAGVGGTYSRRILTSHVVDWYYDLEVTPATFIQDPVLTVTTQSSSGTSVVTAPTDRKCIAETYQLPIDNIVTVTQTCSTRWTYTGGVSPVGLRLNFRPGHRIQPLINSHLGFLAATRDFPVFKSSAMNFTFDFGAGLEMFRDNSHSWVVEYRLHHLSNAYLGYENPGVDSQIVQVAYSFGH